jgi:polar amino acid transport system substrate-binding protein
MSSHIKNQKERRLKMKTKRLSIIQTLWITLLIIGLADVSFSGEIQQQLTAESMIEQALKRGSLKVGMSTFVPWAMKDKTGKLIGFEIDVATRLAKDMGVAAQFVPTKWAGIIPSLLTGKFDVIIGGMGILPNRNLKVNFSIPYDYTGMSMVAHKTLAAGFNSLNDFNRPDVILSVQLGTTAVTAAQKFMPKAQLRYFDNDAQTYQELLNGKVHAVVGSAPKPAEWALKYPDKLFLPLAETFTKEPIGFAVKKGDFDTINYLNNWITFVRADGWLQERKRYWFETRDWENQIQ